MRRVPAPDLSQPPLAPPPSIAASMTSSASPGARLRLLKTVMVRWPLPIESVAPVEPMMPAAWVPLLAVPLVVLALTVMLFPSVRVPPLPSKTSACALRFEAPVPLLLKNRSSLMPCELPFRSKIADWPELLRMRVAVALNCWPMPSPTRITPASRLMLPPTQVETLGIATVQTPEPRFERLLPRVLESRPVKIVLLLSSPTPRVRAEVPETVTVPAPESEPTRSLPAISKVAPDRTVTGLVLVIRSALPSVEAPKPLISLPAATTTGPEKVPVAFNCKLPAPVLRRPPAPLTTPAMVRMALEVVTSMAPMPPVRLKVWELAVVADAIVAEVPV